MGYIPIYKSPNTWSYTIVIRVMLVVLRAECWAKKQKEAKELNMAIQTAIRREIQIEQRKAAAEAARLAEAKAKRE